MAAVMVERIERTVCPEIEGRGHDLMVTWGLHRRGGERTRSPVASGGWSEPLDKAYDNEPPAVLAIDRVLAGLSKAGYEQSVDIAKRFYLEHPRVSVWELAERVRRTEGFVRLTIRGICALVDERVSD